MEGQKGYIMSGDELFFFNEKPAALPLYEAFAQRIFAEIDNFASFQKHIGLYPGPEAVEEFAEQLRDYKTSKGAIHLPYDKPLPIELIKAIAKWCYETGNQ